MNPIFTTFLYNPSGDMAVAISATHHLHVPGMHANESGRDIYFVGYTRSKLNPLGLAAAIL